MVSEHNTTLVSGRNQIEPIVQSRNMRPALKQLKAEARGDNWTRGALS